MSKLLKNFIGISKADFDAALIKADHPGSSTHQQFAQNERGFKDFLQGLHRQDVLLNEQTLFCMECTGVYNSGLVSFLIHHTAQVWVEMPLRIKRAAGFERGHNAKTSAIKTAGYAFRYQDKKQPWRPLDSPIERIKNLIAQRDRITNAMTQLEVPVKELEQCGCPQDAKALKKLQAQPLKALQKTKKEIEQLIINRVQQDEQIHEKVQQVESIKGIGVVTAVTLLA